MNRALIIGASSAIAVAVARELAGRGWQLILAGRDTARLQILAADLEIRGATVCPVLAYDAAEAALSASFAAQTWGEGLDLLLVAHGQLPDQLAAQNSAELTAQMLAVNGSGVVTTLAAFSGLFEARGRGTIAVISSIAGDRGRQSNYVYGSAKAAVTVYCQGLRNRLQRSGVNVLTIKPGFVDTPMTAHLQKGLLWAQPETVARDILRAVEQGTDVLYTPWFWRYIMLVIRMIPEALFKRLSL